MHGDGRKWGGGVGESSERDDDSPAPPPHFLPSPPPPPLLLLIFPPPSPLAILPSPQNLLIEFFWVCLSILSLITTTKSFTL